MTYNVFIQDFSKHFLLALTEDDLAQVIEAHDTGADSISIPGQRIAQLTNFKQIRIFENERGVSSQQITEALDHRARPYGRRNWDVTILEQLGREVTREKLKHGFATQPRAGNLAKVVNSSAGVDFWGLLHPSITEVSKKLYGDRHYKQAAQAALTAVDERVQTAYRVRHADGKHGVQMMSKAFSKEDPVFYLVDRANPQYGDIQEGYMHIFVGVMQAIRNPKSHANFEIEERDAIELLFLASRLLRKLDESQK